MANLDHFRRVVYHHDWVDLGEWAEAINDLADLSDDELDTIQTDTRAVSH
jgi:hypothetical protein